MNTKMLSQSPPIADLLSVAASLARLSFFAGDDADQVSEQTHNQIIYLARRVKAGYDAARGQTAALASALAAVDEARQQFYDASDVDAIVDASVPFMHAKDALEAAVRTVVAGNPAAGPAPTDPSESAGAAILTGSDGPCEGCGWSAERCIVDLGDDRVCCIFCTHIDPAPTGDQT